jgi:ABC-type nitrate/sulfonate/bicarbonate transport system ATPase subunit
MKIEKLSIAFNGKKVLSDFSIEFEDGKTTGFLAPSGFGKTTLLNWICENEMSKGKTVSFAFQEPRLLESATVLENVALPLRNIMSGKDALEKARLFLKKVKMEDKEGSFPAKLSGGEKQRVSLARALSFPSEILLLDEAFNSIDEKTKAEIISFTKSLLKMEGRTTIFVTHNEKEAELLCDSIKKGL